MSTPDQTATTPRLTVAICTLSPRPEVFARVLAALAAQTLPRAAWELLIVDNGSPEPVADVLARFAPAGLMARLVVEATPGIGAARRRALGEACAPLVCFLDDDTVPASTFLERGLAKADQTPRLGCWGGQLRAEWGAPPPPWLGDYRRLLGVHEVPQDICSAEKYSFAALPPTAGMFLRVEVGAEWRRQVATDPRRAWLGSRGRSWDRGEDTDLAFCAHDLGLATGIFTDLEITHIMDAKRLTLEAVAAQVRGSRRSMYVLFALRGRDSFPRPQSRRQRWAYAWARWWLTKPERVLADAERAAVGEARAILAELAQRPPEEVR